MASLGHTELIHPKLNVAVFDLQVCLMSVISHYLVEFVFYWIVLWQMVLELVV